ncbi:MAG: hypothetical protein MUC96_07490 [Myxococcaceae bacterium]|jgi:hypothetical protein|nr:hypothetical protein [Myxococcaceae bacterium]
MTNPFRVLFCCCALTACFEPVDLGFNTMPRDGGHDGGASPCTVGLDQTCNELPTMSSFGGACTASGCVCSAGFEKGPTGRCRPQNSCPVTPQQPGQSCSVQGLTCAYGYAPLECGGRTVRCDGPTWVEVEHTDPQPSCPTATCQPAQRPMCVSGTPGGECGDGALQGVCVSGAWQCPSGTIPSTQCACVGLRPGCTCTPSGWSCAQDAGCTPGTLRFEPTQVRFGERPIGCRAALPLVLWNTCSSAQTVSLSVAAAGPFSLDAGPLTLAPDASVSVPVAFTPLSAGLQRSTVTGTSTSGLLSIPIEGVGTFDTVETFTQRAQLRADLLLVMSDGPGMAPVQAGLAASATSFLQYVLTNGLDVQLGVLRGRADGGGLVEGSLGAPLVVSPSTPNAAQRWSEKFLLGDAWTPTASCLLRASEHLALDAGWLRPDATLSVLCVQDTLEQLPGPVSARVAALRALAPSRDVVVSATARFAPSCAGPDDAVLAAAVAETDGAQSSVCSLDGGPGGTLEFAVPRARRTWALSFPASPDGGLTVTADGQPLPASVGDAGVWSYDLTRNAIVFSPTFAPEPGRSFTVQYRPACTP